MRYRPITLAVAFVLLAAVLVVPIASATGRPACHVSNERTGLGSRSLQDGIDAAAPGDMLIVKGTCVGSSTIDKDLTIKGVSNKVFGASTPTLDGGGVGRVLVVDIGGYAVTLENLTITNGFANDGNPGGGLFARMGHVTTLRNVTVTGNRSEIEGGGIFNDMDGTMAIVGSTVTGNSALYGMGGGIGNGGHATLTITDSTVSGNDANIGGGIANLDGTATVTRSTVRGNSALQGGGVSNDIGGMLTLTDSTVTQNTATDGSGGGIWNGPDSTMTISNSTVSRNHADWAGGVSNYGTLTFAAPPTRVGGNTADSPPGGVFNYSGFGTVTGGCPSSVGGNVIYSPANTPTDYVGFSC